MKLSRIRLAAVMLTLSLSVFPAFAAKQETRSKAHFKLPANAVEVAPNIFSLGTAIDKDGELLEGYAIVHPKKEESRISNGAGRTKTVCYAFLSQGTKWKTVEPYLINPANGDGLSDSFVSNMFDSSIAEWERNAGKNILGSGTVTSETLVSNISEPDGINAVFLGSIDDPYTIAVTTVWGKFVGPTSQRELKEWDMIFNDTGFAWGDVLATGNTSLMDFEDIATHELGHAMGLGHPSDSCTEETMYRFGTYGETKKRDLNTGDIQGIRKLYP